MHKSISIVSVCIKVRRVLGIGRFLSYQKHISDVSGISKGEKHGGLKRRERKREKEGEKVTWVSVLTSLNVLRAYQEIS